MSNYNPSILSNNTPSILSNNTPEGLLATVSFIVTDLFPQFGCC